MDAERAAEIQETYDRQGFVALEACITAGEIAEVRRLIAAIRSGEVPEIDGAQLYFEVPGDRATLKQIQRLYDWHPAFHRLMFEGAVPQLARLLLRDEPVGRNMQYFNKPPGLGQPTPPHQDGYYFMIEPCVAVTMWLALEPVDAETGCVRYLTGSHRAGLQPHERSGTVGFSQQVADFSSLRGRYPETACPAQPGTLLAHDARTVHFADGNRSPCRSREAIGFIFYGAGAREDRAAHQAYQKRLAQDLAARGLT